VKRYIHWYLWGGTSFNTREPAAIIAPSPIFIFPSMVALAPISAPSPTLGWRSPISFPVPPNVTPCQNEIYHAKSIMNRRLKIPLFKR